MKTTRKIQAVIHITQEVHVQCDSKKILQDLEVRMKSEPMFDALYGSEFQYEKGKVIKTVRHLVIVKNEK